MKLPSGARGRASASPDRSNGSARSKLVRVIITSLATLVVLIACVTIGLVLCRNLIVLASTALSPAGNSNRAILQAMTDSQSSLRGYQLTGNTDYLAPYRDAQQPLADAMNSLDNAAAKDPQLEGLAQHERQTVDTWLSTYARSAAERPLQSAAREQAGGTAFDEFRKANTSVGAAVRVRGYAWLNKASWVVMITLISLVVLLILGTVLALLPALRALRLIGPPLEALQATVNRIRSGDAGARADSLLGVVEIQAVAAAMNELAAENQRRQERDAEDLRVAASVRAVSSATGSSLSLGDVVRTSTRTIAEQFGIGAVWLRAFEGEGDLPGPGFGAAYPASAPVEPDPDLVPMARRVARTLWQNQTHCLLHRDPTLGAVNADYMSTAELEKVRALVFGSNDIASMLLVAFGSGPECLGSGTYCRTEGQPAWSESEIAALLAVGHDVGRATVRARNFEREAQLVLELQEIDVKKNDFVSMVSHELRTPLASIIGHLEIVRSGELGFVDPDMDPSLVAIDRNAVRLTTLIEDLLTLSRIEQRARPAKLLPLDLARVAAEMVELHAEPATKKRIRLDLTAPVPAEVLGDELELERVIGNLLSNAIKFSPPGGTVDVDVDVEDHDVVVTITDRGIGVSPRDLAELFQRFFRSSNPAAQAVPGTGLGLAITKLIVEKHQGTIDVHSQLGEGSTFTVRLPRLPAELATASPLRDPATVGV